MIADEDIRAVANAKRLLILEWLKNPRKHFPPQVDGDLVKDGVCGVLIARNQMTSGDIVTFGLYVAGHFSSDLRHAQEREQQLDSSAGLQDYETVLEWTYRLYFRKSAVFFQPDIQYVIQPGGTGHIGDALVLGCQIGINF